MKFKTHAFYIFGIVDFQEQMSVIIQSLRCKNNVWVCMFDSLYKKRQFYYYDSADIVKFVSDVCYKNTLKRPSIDFYEVDSKTRFELDFKHYNPDVVFLHGAYHKYPRWYPHSGKAKVVHFAWGPESPLDKSNYKINLNIVRREQDISAYKNFSIDTKYFGNLRLESLKYKTVFNSFNLKLLEGKKVCFLSETHIRTSAPGFKKYPEMVDGLLNVLREEGYTTIWKIREKGFPKEGWASPLDYISNTPDFVVERDLNFPSSLYLIPSIADMSIIFNGTAAFFDLVDISKNVVVIRTPDLSAGKTKKMLKAYSSVSEGSYHLIVDPEIGRLREQLFSYGRVGSNPHSIDNPSSAPSKKILGYIEN